VLRLVAPARPQHPIAVSLDDIAPAMTPLRLASNGTDRILLLVEAPPRPGEPSGPVRRLLVLDATGGLVDALSINGAPPHDLTGLRDLVWIADAQGLRRFGPGAPSVTRPMRGRFLTPALYSPEGRERGWLRAELFGDLPPQAMLRVRYASTSDVSLKERVAALAADTSAPATVRAQRVTEALRDLWSAPMEIAGPSEDAAGASAPSMHVVPLHAAAGPWLWLDIEVLAAAADRVPVISELRVRYPELSLMRHLPAIYRDTDDRNSFLRRIVAVLEATTQDLDARIESLGRLIDPAHAPADWLGFLGSWIGLPWHDDLPESVQRCLLGAAATLLRTRGTRAGIIALLRCVLPGRRVRITDFAVDVEPLVIGGRAGSCASPLPGVLLGRPNAASVLGSPHAVIGHIRLPCPGDTACDPLDTLERRLRIEIRASQHEKEKFDPILREMLRDFVPLGLRLELRWRSTAGTGTRLDDFVLDGYRPATLGHEPVLGRVTLSRETAGRLRAGGLASGFELQ
jgi:phage tail-like protein